MLSLPANAPATDLYDAAGGDHLAESHLTQIDPASL
jgi:hypothetical protein